MRVVCLSDTHSLHEQLVVPDGDMIIHSGDATNMGTIPAISTFIEWYHNLPHKHKIFVAGNHDWLFEQERYFSRYICQDAGITYLEDSGTEVAGLKVYGTPWTPRFFDWAFNGGELVLREQFKLIPEGLDILITHGPPFGILDSETTVEGGIEQTTNLGCKILRQRVDIVKPKVHIFGHIHGGYGQYASDDTLFINAAIGYNNGRPHMLPQVLDI